MSTSQITPILPALSSAAMVPSDFVKRTTSPNYRRWSVGALRHVVAALEGAPVAVVTDTQTGSTALNVRLVGVAGARGGSGYVLLVEHVDSEFDFQGRPVGYRLEAIGTIIPLTVDGAGAKWVATKSYMEEKRAAVSRAQAEHGDGRYGRWEATPGYSATSVTFEPQSDDSLGRGHWTYRTKEVAA